MHTTALVIGGGIFGSVIARALNNCCTTTLVDARLQGAGSPPAGLLMKPSWFAGLGKEVYRPAMTVLDKLYGVEDIEFVMRPLRKKTTAHFVPPDKLRFPVTVARCTEIKDHTAFFDRLDPITYDLLVIATGAWTDLTPEVKMKPKWGISLFWPGLEDPPENFIEVWAPYKQIVGFNRGDGYWAGDGTALLERSMTPERIQQSIDRVKKAVKIKEEPFILKGARPYVPGAKPCYMDQRKDGTWVVTGGAKNGLLAAGWAAFKIFESLVGVAK